MASRPHGSPASLALRAAFSPLPLIVAAASVAGALLLSPLVIIPGALVWASLVYALGPGKRSVHREPPVDISSFPPTIQRDVMAVKESLSGIQATVRTAPRDQRAFLEGLLSEAQQLDSAIGRLGLQAARVHGYLSSTHEDGLRHRVEKLEADLAAADEPGARAELGQALEASRQQLAQREQLRATLDQYYAAMRNLKASAADMHSRVIALASGQTAAADAATQPLPELDEMRASVAALEEVMQRTVD